MSSSTEDNWHTIYWGTRTSSLLVFRLRWCGGEVRQGALNRLWHWRSCRQVRALGLETILVRGVRQLNIGSVLIGILVLTFDFQRVHISNFLQVSLLVGTDPVSSFERILVWTIAVNLAILTDDGNRLGRCLRRCSKRRRGENCNENLKKHNLIIHYLAPRQRVHS